MITIAIANQKGGCGKTTTAVNLAASISDLGKSVLLIDMDPQGHASLALGIDTELLEQTTYHALMSPPIALPDVTLPVLEGLHIVPTNVGLAALEQELAGQPQRELRLKLALEDLPVDYDYVIIDCSPSLGFLTINALVAADEVIVPLDSSSFALHGLEKLLDTIDMVETNTSKRIVTHALATQFNPRTKFGRGFFDELRGRFGDRLFETAIHSSVVVKTAAARGLPLGKIHRNCRVHHDYLALATELLESAPYVEVDDTLGDISGDHATAADGELVTFRMYAPEATTVCVAGEFNDWDALAGQMEPDVAEGLWRFTTRLVPGRYRYRFIVDGTWLEDPEAPYEESVAGYRNSIIDVAVRAAQ